MRLTAYEVNTYLAMLTVTIIASGATLLIVRVATASEFTVFAGSESEYKGLQRSILGK
jgi:hypothetical protein